MSRSKEATVVLLDAGPSMATALRERGARNGVSGARLVTTRFDAAVAAVESVVQQKLFFKPKDEIGIVIYGSDETDNQLNEEQGQDEYRNVQVIHSIDTPNLHMCERLRELQPSSGEDTKVDILDGLIVALDLLYRRTEGKKYDKKLLVITDAAAKITDASDMESVVQMVQSMEVKLQIVGLDFRNTTDKPKQEQPPAAAQPGDVKDEPMEAVDEKDVVKVENEKMLVSIATEVGGEVSSVSRRMQLLAQGMKKSVAPTTKFRGNLEIGGDFGIPVFCYLKTKTATLPTLAKESQVSYEKETAARVKIDRRYTNPRDPDEEVPPDHQVKAYRYGKEKVPFSSADVEFFKFQTEKSLKVLGFLDKSQLSPAKFIDPTDVFIAEPGKPYAAQSLAALIEGMLELNQVAIARFVARKNAAPKIVALVPHKPSSTSNSGGENYYALWSNQLAFDEDVRTYEFAPLKTRELTPTDKQQQLADQLVDSLSIRAEKADDIGSCFNPVVARFFNAVRARAFDEATPIPPVPPFIDSNLNMDSARKEQLSELIASFGDAFQLREAVKEQGKKKKKSFWSDVPAPAGATDTTGDEDGGTGDQDGGEESDAELDLDELLDAGGGVTSVGSMNPIADFETLVDVSRAKSHRVERLTSAVTGMQEQIEKFLGQSEPEFHAKGLQCLVHFRKRSPELQYAQEFNDFLIKLKAALAEESTAWATVKREGVMLLSSDDDPSVSITPALARAFLYGDEPLGADAAAAALSQQVAALEDEDDMFADFE